MKNLKKIKENMYEFETEEMVVQFVYSENTKKFNESFLNILKVKMQ